jgi:hypothetical protein
VNETKVGGSNASGGVAMSPMIPSHATPDDISLLPSSAPELDSSYHQQQMV